MKRVAALISLILIAGGSGSSETANRTPIATGSLAGSVRKVAPSIVQVAISIVLPTKLPPELLELQKNSDNPRVINQVLGTGFMVTNEYLITALHVVKDGDHLLTQTEAASKLLGVGFVTPPSNDVRLGVLYGAAKLVDQDDSHDIALLKLTLPEKAPTGTTAVSFASQRPDDGEPVAISGYPFGNFLLTNSGSMASSWNFSKADLVPSRDGKQLMLDFNDVYLADLKVNFGDSGSPVYLAENGLVIGMCVAFTPTPVVYKVGTETKVAKQDGQLLMVNSGIAQVIPAKYITDLLKKNRIHWLSDEATSVGHSSDSK